VTGEQRMICRAAARVEYRPEASRRFSRLVVVRRSWGYWFVAEVAGLNRGRLTV
jgi:hypothetical protein